jgi:hypothetical protein
VSGLSRSLLAEKNLCAVPERDVPPGQLPELGVQARMVLLHDSHVVSAAADQIGPVISLGVQGVGVITEFCRSRPSSRGAKEGISLLSRVLMAGTSVWVAAGSTTGPKGTVRSPRPGARRELPHGTGALPVPGPDRKYAYWLSVVRDAAGSCRRFLPAGREDSKQGLDQHVLGAGLGPW